MNKQTEAWSSKFGVEYTDRNFMTVEEMEELTEKYYGISRTKINEMFFKDFRRDIRILEVGCNIGNQLECLQRMGFNNLYGIDISQYAVELCKENSKGINVIRGDGSDIPFKECYFDLVFTSGVLIHINETDLPKVMKEIYRCSSKYIFGFEYYAEKRTEIKYRGNNNMLWKDDFPRIYCGLFPNLMVEKEQLFKYQENDNYDIAFLLRK